MKTRPFLFVALAIGIAASSTHANEGGGDAKSAAESATLKRILAHWKARQDRVKSFHVVLRDRLTLLKGSIDNLKEPEKKGPLVHCDKDEVYQSVQEIWLDGDDHCRYQAGEFFNPPPAEMKEAGRIAHWSTFDGHDWSWFLEGPWCRGPRHSTRGFVRGVVRKVTPADLDLDQPLRLAFRADHPSLPWRLANCRLITNNAIIDGVRYVEIEQSNSGWRHQGADYCRVWVDPSRDDIAVFGEERYKVDVDWAWHGSIDYRKDSKYGWIPSHWFWACGGTQARTSNCTVIRFAFNEKLPPEMFVPKFPPGTPVRDRTSGQQYVVQKDGSKRLITREEVDHLWQPRDQMK